MKIVIYWISAVASLVCFPLVASSQVVNLSQTGQITCYDSEGEVIPCGGTGQDGDIRAGAAWPNPRFTGSGDCVTDNLTGLMWVRRLDTASRTWQEALDYANALTLCGYNDWHVPSMVEFDSLLPGEEPSPAVWLNALAFCNIQQEPGYWTSTTTAYSPEEKWRIYLLHGCGYPAGSLELGYAFPVRMAESSDLLSLSVTTADNPDPVDTGENLTYTITVTNNGPEHATGVTIMDELPEGVDFLSFSTSQGSCSGSGIVTCLLGTINSGNSATVTVLVVPHTEGTLTGTVSVTGVISDPDLTNNTATVCTEVTGLSSGGSGDGSDNGGNDSGGTDSDGGAVDSGDGDGGSGCFIATATYGSFLAPEVEVLRRWRDNYLLNYSIGRAFVGYYYKFSPPLANYIGRHDDLRIATRWILTPIVYGVKYPKSALLIIMGIAMAFWNLRKILRYVSQER
jgi:uncharacterized repeat protein (TIGR01451 family)